MWAHQYLESRQRLLRKHFRTSESEGTSTLTELEIEWASSKVSIRNDEKFSVKAWICPHDDPVRSLNFLVATARQSGYRRNNANLWTRSSRTASIMNNVHWTLSIIIDNYLAKGWQSGVNNRPLSNRNGECSAGSMWTPQCGVDELSSRITHCEAESSLKSQKLQIFELILSNGFSEFVGLQSVQAFSFTSIHAMWITHQLKEPETKGHWRSRG